MHDIVQVSKISVPLYSCICLLFYYYFFVELRTELDAVSSFSEIVPDTVIFDDFDRYLFSYLFSVFF